MVNKIDVGRRINRIRGSLGYNKREFGDLFGASGSLVSKWEKGEVLPSPQRLSDIAFFGQISVDELLYNLDTDTSIMDDFIEYLRKTMLEDADDAFRNGETQYYNPGYIYAKEAAEEFIKVLGANK